MFHGYIAVISITYRFVEQRKTYFSYYPSMFHDCNLNNYFAHFLHNYFAHIAQVRVAESGGCGTSERDEGE